MVTTEVVVLYSLIPMVIALIGGFIASFFVPKGRVVSGLQHLVAGVVVGAVAVELLPKILGSGETWTLAVGFILGVVAMLLLHELAHFLAKKEGKGGLPLGLVVAGAIDLLIDGILIGVSFLAGKESGILIALSLSLCAFFLNLTISATMTKRKSGRGVHVLAVIAIALMLPIGAFIGGSVLSHFPQAILMETLAFGVAALLYLGVEELLAEAHEERDTAWTSALFFLGFLLILLFKF